MSGFSVESPSWDTIDAVEVIDQIRIEKDHALIPTDQGVLRVSVNQFGVRLQIGDRIDFDYQLLVNKPNAQALTIAQPDSASSSLSAALSTTAMQTKLVSGATQVVISHQPFAIQIKHNDKVIQQSASDGHFVRRYRLPPLARVDKGWFMAWELASSEPVYGLGEKWGKLDKRGQLIRSFNHDALGVNAEISYKNAPFAWSPNGWGLFVHTPSPVTHGVGYAPWSQRSYGVLVEDSALDLFIFTGHNGEQQIQTYTELTGKAPMPPEWSLGVILSKAYYQDADELLATARAVRQQQMPCDVITLDGRAWQDTETRFAFEWDKTRYPDPKPIIDQLKAMQFKICIWEYPLISVENPLYQQLADKGWLIKDKRTGQAYQYEWDMSAFGEVLTPLPKSGILDFTHPEAYAFWRDSHQSLFALGIDMIKADFGEQIEDDNMLASNGESGMALHNVYSLLYNRCVYEAAEEFSQNGAFLFSRSAWTGSQRYPAQWGGDPQADWGGLAASLRGGQSWGLTGAPFYATDVGGFYKDTRDAELYVRWLQSAVFSAHMRLHGIGQREPWSYGALAEQAANRALKLRYQLLPYLHQTMMQASETGLPVQRAMVLAFPNERQAWAFEDQFMLGDKLLVIPCLQAGGDIEFYLPFGDWCRFEPDLDADITQPKHYQGSKLYRERLALADYAVFIRKGDTVPLGAAVEHTEQLKALGMSVASVTRYWPDVDIAQGGAS
ncbi:alpha-xylosidase [Thalassotalea euphylliae]|uniref:Alpha-xylosidase n=1 Tax=Thalassotalea euphylliae TaxID=1655234 RepID=A0A3E0TN61_9GAMM|nr:alpha-xylosidase [Thalassotalea euphylliae]REL25455.1 alpha-xylosidase [Thalassotalea euphylliae]